MWLAVWWSVRSPRYWTVLSAGQSGHPGTGQCFLLVSQVTLVLDSAAWWSVRSPRYWTVLPGGQSGHPGTGQCCQVVSQVTPALDSAVCWSVRSPRYWTVLFGGQSGHPGTGQCYLVVSQVTPVLDSAARWSVRSPRYWTVLSGVSQVTSALDSDVRGRCSLMSVSVGAVLGVGQLYCVADTPRRGSLTVCDCPSSGCLAAVPDLQVPG